MKIRSITSFFDPSTGDISVTLRHLARFTNDCRQAFERDHYEVQTTRLATTPFPTYIDVRKLAVALKQIAKLGAAAEKHGFNYLAIGPALPTQLESYALIPHVFTETQNVFASGVMATKTEGIHLPAVRACGELIAKTAQIDPNGFANLNFAAIANVPAFGPFFPSAYSEGSLPAFALAIESADLAQQAFRNSNTLEGARQTLLQELNALARSLTTVAETMAEKHGIAFKGLDISLAPFPSDDISLGGAMEALCGEGQIGLGSSLTAAALIAETLDRGTWLKTGFNGLMLPVLEDSILAKRTIKGYLTVKDLLLYSAVCGAGLDTVPLPGNTTPEQLSALLLDVAALAIRLDKPLTARLMPVPGKKAGQDTTFDFGFFANGRVMDMPAGALSDHFKTGESIKIKSRLKR